MMRVERGRALNDKHREVVNREMLINEGKKGEVSNTFFFRSDLKGCDREFERNAGKTKRMGSLLKWLETFQLGVR